MLPGWGGIRRGFDKAHAPTFDAGGPTTAQLLQHNDASFRKTLASMRQAKRTLSRRTRLRNHKDAWRAERRSHTRTEQRRAEDLRQSVKRLERLLGHAVEGPNEEHDPVDEATLVQDIDDAITHLSDPTVAAILRTAQQQKHPPSRLRPKAKPVKPTTTKVAPVDPRQALAAARTNVYECQRDIATLDHTSEEALATLHAQYIEQQRITRALIPVTATRTRARDIEAAYARRGTLRREVMERFQLEWNMAQPGAVVDALAQCRFLSRRLSQRRTKWSHARATLLARHEHATAAMEQYEADVHQWHLQRLTRDAARRQRALRLRTLRETRAAAAAMEQMRADEKRAKEREEAQRRHCREAARRQGEKEQLDAFLQQREAQFQDRARRAREERAQAAHAMAATIAAQAHRIQYRYELLEEKSDARAAQQQQERDRAVQREHRLEALRATVRIDAPLDPARVLRPTASVDNARLAVEPRALFAHAKTGFTEEELFRDKRYRVAYALRQRGVESNAYAREKVLQQPAARPQGRAFESKIKWSFAE